MGTMIESAAWPPRAEAFCGRDGETLLRFMRAMFFGGVTPAEMRTVADQAVKLGWIELYRSRPRLTFVGSIIADSAREYCNWLDENRSLPLGMNPEEVRGRRVLDLGCGFGRHLLALQSRGADSIGVDLGESYLQLSPLFAAREQQPTPARVCATGDRLPFSDACFDLVLCIRSLPYMKVLGTLRETARVLVDGGRLVLVMSPFGALLSRALSVETWRRGMRHGLRNMGLVANSLAYQWTGRRMITPGSDNPTASPVHVTERCLHRWMHCVGFDVQRYEGQNGRLVGLRVPRTIDV